MKGAYARGCNGYHKRPEQLVTTRGRFRPVSGPQLALACLCTIAVHLASPHCSQASTEAIQNSTIRCTRVYARGEGGGLSIPDVSISFHDGTAHLFEGDTVTISNRFTVAGRIDGIGPGAALVLTDAGGGSGTFVYLALLATQDAPSCVALAELGDRTKVVNVNIEHGRAHLDLIVRGPDDGMCCPTLHASVTYRVDKTHLNEEGFPTAGRYASLVEHAVLEPSDTTRHRTEVPEVHAGPQNAASNTCWTAQARIDRVVDAKQSRCIAKQDKKGREVTDDVRSWCEQTSRTSAFNLLEAAWSACPITSEQVDEAVTFRGRRMDGRCVHEQLARVERLLNIPVVRSVHELDDDDRALASRVNDWVKEVTAIVNGYKDMADGILRAAQGRGQPDPDDLRTGADVMAGTAALLAPLIDRGDQLEHDIAFTRLGCPPYVLRDALPAIVIGLKEIQAGLKYAAYEQRQFGHSGISSVLQANHGFVGIKRALESLGASQG
jgi:hypothetical protein